jgi:hypothetical protein
VLSNALTHVDPLSAGGKYIGGGFNKTTPMIGEPPPNRVDAHCLQPGSFVLFPVSIRVRSRGGPDHDERMGDGRCGGATAFASSA